MNLVQPKSFPVLDEYQKKFDELDRNCAWCIQRIREIPLIIKQQFESSFQNFQSDLQQELSSSKEFKNILQDLQNQDLQRNSIPTDTKQVEEIEQPLLQQSVIHERESHKFEIQRSLSPKMQAIPKNQYLFLGQRPQPSKFDGKNEFRGQGNKQEANQIPMNNRIQKNHLFQQKVCLNFFNTECLPKGEIFNLVMNNQRNMLQYYIDMFQKILSALRKACEQQLQISRMAQLGQMCLMQDIRMVAGKACDLFNLQITSIEFDMEKSTQISQILFFQDNAQAKNQSKRQKSNINQQSCCNIQQESEAIQFHQFFEQMLCLYSSYNFQIETQKNVYDNPLPKIV